MKRLNLALTDEAYHQIQKVAAHQGTSITDVIRRFLEVGFYLWMHRTERLFIRNLDGQDREIVLFL